MTTQEHILKAAEEEFLEQGYDKAKISSIAERAEVNHSLVHYYFRTKENLFNIVFQNKMELLSSQLTGFDQEMDFFEQLKSSVDFHFEFLRENPRLLLFILREIATDLNQLNTLKNMVMPKITKVYERLDQAMQREIERGRVKPTLTIDVMMNMVAMNAASILLAQIQSKMGYSGEKELDDFLKHRKESVKQTIIDGIKV